LQISYSVHDSKLSKKNWLAVDTVIAKISSKAYFFGLPCS